MTRVASWAFTALTVFAIGVALLLIVVPLLFGYERYVITGGSMEPTIPKGALVLAVPAASYGVGDVVAVAQPGNTPYTHRISRLAALDGEPYVETKGDAN